ncbi:Uncharacterised protein [BD1-7 clade bacterium]|uniref:Toxin SymE-like domain-containing protein n=1 Tax=BD1-7 clade bacterium TaxID=2029982 RepID=A0A5S9P6G3_9GAMM|nr:Uncharacterised protein [BD1-7 clade bacterium]
MADQDITLEPRSAKEKFPISRKFTVLETVVEGYSRAKNIGVNYVPVKLEPCVVLRGKWLRDAGFEIGDEVVVTLNENDISIKPAKLLAER